MWASTTLVGRDRELERLEEQVRQAAAGRGGTVLVAGDAGIGKTRLVTELAARARDAGAQLLVGRCIDLVGAEVPYLTAAEALRPLLAREELRKLLGSAPELRWLLPETVVGEDPTRQPDGAPGSRLGLLEELLALLDTAAATDPILLVLEDLHWADRSTLDLVAFLAHNLGDRRVLLVGTYRAEELPAEHRLRRLVAGLVRAGVATRLELGPLARAEMEALLLGRSRTPLAPETMQAIVTRSEGNPFFAEELLAGGQGGLDLPHVLRELLLQRVAQLDRETRDVLGVAAAAGRDVPYRLLAAVADVPEGELRQGLRRAVDHGVLVGDQAAGTFRFRHALLAEAIYGTLLPGEREELHARLAAELARSPRPVSAELAQHWAAAGHAPEALVASVTAAREAQAVFGLAEAAQHLERALALWDLVPGAAKLVGLDLAALLAWTAEVADATGAGARAVELMRRAITLVVDDPVRAALLQEGLGRFLVASGGYEAALAAFRSAVDLVPAEPVTAEGATCWPRSATR